MLAGAGTEYSYAMLRAPDLAGRALDDRYELHEMLGEGAFGRVYRGFDRRLGRAVAVKVIKPWWAEDSEWVERFEREAQLLARVSDPGVVQIFDIGYAEEGPYYVAELVDGESLAARLRRGPLPPARACEIAERLCRALASAHREGVLHCDVKPANVLLGAGGEVKVGDFGVARLAEGTSQAVSATVAGTPRYMSPEQARGRATTAATDVYSAGVVLYEMLAGHPPFVDGSVVELGLRHLQDEPPPLGPGVAPALRAVVERALAKEPDARYRDGGEMADAIAAAAPSAARVTAVAARAADGDLASAPSTSEASPRTRVLERGGDARTRVKPKPPRPPADPPGRGRAGGARGRRRALAVLAVLALGAGALAAIVLSGSAARTSVPELRGLPRGGVQARAARLHVSPAFSARHSQATAGIAIAQSPAPGTRVNDGATVDVTLSSGPPPVALPNVLGRSLAFAERAIAAAGLRYSLSTVAAPGRRPGAIVRQLPSAPGTAPRGSTVALSVAEAPRWRALTSFSGVDDGHSVAFRILGSQWRVSYSMAYQGTCLLLLICAGPSARVADLEGSSTFGSFELNEGEAQTHTFSGGPGLYRIEVSGGRDSARWSMTVEDHY